MDRSRIAEALEDIAGRLAHVRFTEIENLLDKHIKPLCQNFNHHGHPHHAFTVFEQTFVVVEPKKSPFVKKVYVKKFLEAMQGAGFYCPEGKK
jgi:hypothetical protein